MENFEWKFTPRLNFSILKVLGLWPKGEDSYKLNFYVLQSATLILVFLLGHIFFQAVNIFVIFDDLEAVTGTVFILLTEVMAIFKSYYLIKNMKILKQLMMVLNDGLFQPKNDQQINTIRPFLRFWSTVYYSMTVISVGAMVLMSIFPILDKSHENKLPFLAWYPFDYRKSPYYELAYVYQIVSTGYIGIVNLNIDTLIACLNMYVGCQFDLLCDNLRNIKKCDEEERPLMKCVLHHRMILEFTKNSNKFYESIIFLQFFTSAISLGLTMFKLTLVKAFTSEFYSLISYSNAVIVQIFMYCWFGNEVEDKSQNVLRAAFECEWIYFSPKFKNELIIFTSRTQKPAKLSAFNLFYLSLETFVKILSRAWSFFAVLKQINSTA